LNGSAVRLGIDLGGTKIELIALGPDGSELWRKRTATPSGDYRGTLNAIALLVEQAEKVIGFGPSTLGIGTPGALAKTNGLLRNSNSQCLNGMPLQEDLQTLLRRPVRIANDADCFALSEATDGAGVEADTVFGVILGTGVGGGIVVNRRLLSGPNAIAGEWGHNPLPWPQDDERPGSACYCGKSGCIETFLSGPGLTRMHAHLTGDHPIDAIEIGRRAAAGCAACERSMRAYEDRLARALAHVINILDPHVIVLGGGLSNCGRLYQNVPRLWQRYVFSDQVATRLLPPRHGDSSGVRGAARLWND
jgi:fructokinase